MVGSEWNRKNLVPAKLKDVSFMVASRSMSGGRRKAMSEPSYRDGQMSEDLGLSPVAFDLEIPLYRGMASTTIGADAIYPGTLDRILALIESQADRGEVEYIDPAYGAYKVAIMTYRWQEAGERQNGGMLSLRLEQVGLDGSILADVLSGKLSARARAFKYARRADYNFQTLLQQPDITQYKRDEAEGLNLSNAWNKFQDLLDKGAMAFDDIGAQIDSVTYLAERIMTFDAGEELARWAIVMSCIDFIGAAKEVGQTAKENPGAAMLQWTLPSAMSIYEIAQARYGDTSRADEIAQNNPNGNPLYYPGGTTVQVLSE